MHVNAFPRSQLFTIFCFYRFAYAIHGIDDRYSVPLFHVILSERGDQWLMAHYTIPSFLPCPAL